MADTGSEYKLIDTRAFDAAIARRESLENKYTDIITTYDGIIKRLNEQWQGKGAAAFFEDAETIGNNIKGIADILTTMCNTLNDCRDVIQQTDKALGDFNRNPNKS